MNLLAISSERVVSERTPDMVYQEHIMRYLFASRFVADKIILDVACGTGYGSTYLLNGGAKKVIGVDISKDAIKYATKHYRGSRLHFLCMDATELGFRNNLFDMICSFEVIEHIKEYNKLLFQIRRVLKKEGVCIISTPSKEIHSPHMKKPLNPFHAQEFTIEEFRNILSNYFEDVALFGQKFSVIGRLFSLFPYGPNIKNFLAEKLFYKMDTKFRITKRHSEKFNIEPLKEIQRILVPSYVVAVCKKITSMRSTLDP